MRRRVSSIPSLLALILLILVILGLTLTRDQVTKFFPTASTKNFSVSDVEISNVGENGWTVSWTTALKSTGVVYYGRTERINDGVAFDDRDRESALGEYTTHLVTVRNVKPGRYFFKIGVGKEKLGRNVVFPYPVIVPPPLKEGGKTDPVYGQVVNASGRPAANAIILFTAAGSQTLAVMTGSDGKFVIPLTTIRSVDLKSHFAVKDGQNEQIKVIGENLTSSVVTCLGGYDRPLPKITLAQSLNCSKSPVPLLQPKR